MPKVSGQWRTEYAVRVNHPDGTTAIYFASWAAEIPRAARDRFVRKGATAELVTRQVLQTPWQPAGEQQ